MLRAHLSGYPMGILYSACILMPQKKGVGGGSVCKRDNAGGRWTVTIPFLLSDHTATQ